jgi:hypothetical protein
VLVARPGGEPDHRGGASHEQAAQPLIAGFAYAPSLACSLVHLLSGRCETV